MLTSDLLLRVINNKLTPDLTQYVEMAKVEMDYSFTVDLPQPDGMSSKLWNSHYQSLPLTPINRLD